MDKDFHVDCFHCEVGFYFACDSVTTALHRYSSGSSTKQAYLLQTLAHFIFR